MLEYIFYFLTLTIGLAFEINSIHPKGVARIIEMRKQLYAGVKVNELAMDYQTLAYTSSLYAFIGIIGLFSSQWLLFLLLLSMGLLPKRESVTHHIIDGYISIFINLFIIINKFHLHINIYEWLTHL